MPYCSAYGCTNTTSGGKNREKNVGFFSFPNSQVLRKAWIHAMRRKDFEPTKHSTVCSDHFDEEDFATYPPKLRAMGFMEKVKWKLKETAIPSKVILPSESINEAPSTSKPRTAFLKRRRKETISAIERQELGHSREALPTVPSPVHEEPQDVSPPVSYIVKSKYTQTPIKGIDTILTVTPIHVTDTIEDLTTKEKIDNTDDDKAISNEPPSNVEMTGTKTSSPDELPSEESSSDGSEPPSSDEYEPDDYDFDDVEDAADDEDDHTTNEYLSSHEEPHKERKFIVYESCLRELLSVCNVCQAICLVKIVKTSGTMAVFQSECQNNHFKEWRSQPMLDKLAHGNMCVAAASFFSGSSAEKIILFFDHLNLQCYNKRTYYRLQRAYLVPSVDNVWKTEQESILGNYQGQQITVGGDGRCDSPGHCAKYCSYTMMDLERNVILDTQLVQCNETTSSNAMELEGLKRCKATLEDFKINVDALVTDRHTSVKKFMKESWADVKHFFDVWHVAKGVNKKLLKAGAKKGCNNIQDWIKSIVNHMYWVASTSGDDGIEKKEKWCSIMFHICNIHDGFEGNFKQCQHEAIEDHREWIKTGSRPYKMLSEVIMSPYLLRDIPKLSPRLQTYGLEVFHTVLLGFAPKHTHYFYKGMKARICLAALHFNENGSREQAVTKGGKKCWSVSYPKANKGEKAVPKKIKVAATYGYVDRLLTQVFQRRSQFPTFSQANQDAIMNYADAPAAVNATFEQFDKDELIQRRCSRFPCDS